MVHIGARLPSGPDDPAQAPFADAWRAFRGVQADLSRHRRPCVHRAAVSGLQCVPLLRSGTKLMVLGVENFGCAKVKVATLHIPYSDSIFPLSINYIIFFANVI